MKAAFMLKIRYLGHAGFHFDDGQSKVVIDPYLIGNPLAAEKPDDVEADYVLITHAHGDHAADGIEIALRSGATVISTSEVAAWSRQQGAKAHSMHIGGAFDFTFGRVKLTIAHHGNSVRDKDGNVVSLGPSCGMLIMMGGKTVYHAGDTGLFLDMKLIGELNAIDIALLPIGGNYTMDAADALHAVKFLNPKLVIPMHYNTFDVIPADPPAFAEEVEKLGKAAKVMEVGETIVAD
jgi:L-ascorbate metabolism protein UlaG (beta-lactamase superfamily)